MRHSLTDPAFPDIVGEWAAEQARNELQLATCANDNHAAREEALEALVAKAEIEATRLW